MKSSRTERRVPLPLHLARTAWTARLYADAPVFSEQGRVPASLDWPHSYLVALEFGRKFPALDEKLAQS